MTIRNSNEWLSLPIDTLKPYGRQVRRHDRQSVSKLKKLIGHFGQIVPVIIDADRVIIDGHAAWLAMREMGAGEIATVTVAGRSDPEIKALRLALNRLPQEADWDSQALRAEFEELVSLSFDLDLTGFDAAEVDQVLDLDLPQANLVEGEATIPPVEAAAVSHPGDIWCCGDHRLGCGNPHDQEFVARVSESVLADVVFIDPPYSVPIAVSGKGRNKHSEFMQGTPETPSEQFTEYLATALKVLKASCSSKALIYACTDWRHVHDLLSAGIRSALELCNVCVWAKANAGMDSLYRNQHELVCVFKAGGEIPFNGGKLSRHRRHRSNLWTYHGSDPRGSERHVPAWRPTVKPVALIADVLRDVTKRGDIVLDTFMGSGSTLIAAEQTGRRCFGTELDPLHVDVAVRRWQTQSKRDAVHAESGEPFSARAQKAPSETRDGE